MNEKTLLFKPDAEGRLKKSALYAVPIFGKMLTLCSDYLMKSVGKSIDRKVTDDYLDMFWKMHFQHSFTSLYATGQNVLTPGETYVFMSNHESWMDIPAMFGAAPKSLRMVSKAGLMKVPILGHAMHTAGFVAIDRQNRSKAIKQLDEARKRLDEGISIWIAPEGTRSRNGMIGSFKKGGFYLAKQLKKSIGPVFIEGAAKVMAPDSVAVKPNQSITVHFCRPVTPEEFEDLTSSQLADRVREIILAKQREVTAANEDPDVPTF